MNLKKNIISILNKLPYIRGLYKDKMELRKNSCYALGHYYSIITSVDELKQNEDKVWFNENIDGIQGINLNVDEQVNLVQQFEKYYNEIPFTEHNNDINRFFYDNGFYFYTDAIFLYSMIRYYCPKQIIEIGAGFSSSAMLDTNEQFLNNSIEFTFIEPYPDRLKGLLRSGDSPSSTIIEKKVQDVDLETFKKLNPGDFLFVDSSHVVKTGNDVNYILFEILPCLKSGVFIHFHDIFYPFEYPREWVFSGKNWNESYFLRAFLMYNDAFEIKLFSNYLHRFQKEVFKNMPLCYKDHGSNLWLLKK